jgi:hypothetical protein
MAGLFDRIRNFFADVEPEPTDSEKAEALHRNIAERQISEVMALENAYAGQDDLWEGEVLDAIDFSVLASEEEREHFDNGIAPWINIVSREAEVEGLIDPDSLALNYPNAKIVFDYPLANPTTRDISTSGEGFSRRELVELIGRFYEEIYEEEEASATTKTLSMSERKIMNRNQTDGIYGIWGHDLDDIALSGVEVRRTANGEIILILGIES